MLLSIFGDSIMAGVVQEEGGTAAAGIRFSVWRRKPAPIWIITAALAPRSSRAMSG